MTEFVSIILGPVTEKLASLAAEEIQLVCGIKDEIEKLKRTTQLIQKVLIDAERKQTKDTAVRTWLLNVKDFCYDAENVLDDFEAEALWRQVRLTEHSTPKRKVRYLFSWISSFMFQFKMAHSMKALRKRLDEINEGKTWLNLSSDVYEETMVTRKETHSFELPSNVIGREEEKKSLIGLLIGPDDGGAEKIAVVPIIGMGGTGKTTLAKLVYNDDRVKTHFHHEVWLSMPVEFEVKKIIEKITESLGHKEKSDSFDNLQDCLRRIVENKRFLFVMDDVWKVRREDWIELRVLLEGVSPGSKVIVTSRDKSVAEVMGTVPSSDLAGLSPAESLSLFVKYEFNEGQEKKHPDLMAIGEQIVNKCGGNPLALRALGCLLYSKDDRSEWERVRDSEIWKLETDILPSLRISYDQMPSHLKRCFVCCSIFPKKHLFSNLHLIPLWISNGCIQSSGNNQELEEIGRGYLKELLSRSFFDVDSDKDYPLLAIRMHDLIHDLAISVAGTGSSNMETPALEISPRTRYISFPNRSLIPDDELRGYSSKLSGVHTIMFEKLDSNGVSFLELCISQCKHLRVLLVEDGSFDHLPVSVGRLKLLRYLSLCCSDEIERLPKSICELRNLQFLDLAWCDGLEELPAGIDNLISLRALYITTKQQRLSESRIERLTSLRWLFITYCPNLEALLDDIQSLTLLRKLFIIDCPNLNSLPLGIENLRHWRISSL